MQVLLNKVVDALVCSVKMCDTSAWNLFNAVELVLNHSSL